MGEAWEFTLPSGSHPDGKAVSVEYSYVELGKATLFIRYIEGSGELSIDAGASKDNHIGSYPIKM